MNETLKGELPRSPSVLNDYLWTTLASGIFIVANVIYISLVARRGADTVFAPYSFASRLGASVVPLMCLGMNLGIVRLLNAAKADRDRIIRVSTLLFMSSALILTGTVAIVGPWVERLLPLVSPAAVYWPIWSYVVAVSMNSFAYGILRGELRQNRANLLTVVGMSLLPLVVVLASPSQWSGPKLIEATAAVIILWAAIMIAPRICLAFRHPWSRNRPSPIRELLSVSLPKVPAVVAAALLFVVGPWVAGLLGDTLEVNYLLGGFSAARGIGAAVAALALVLMPRIAALVQTGNHDEAKILVEKSVHLNMLVAVVATPIVCFSTPALVYSYLGDAFMSGVPTIRIVLLGVPGMLMYSLLASILDGAFREPYTAMTSAGSLVLCVVMSFALRNIQGGIALSYVVCQSLAALTLLQIVRRRIDVSLHWRHLSMVGVCSVIVSGFVFWLVSLTSMGSVGQLIVMLVAAPVVLAFAVLSAPRELGLQAIVRRFTRVARP